MEPAKSLMWMSGLTAACVLLAGGVQQANARQNIVSAGIASRYEYQERDYDNEGTVTENGTIVLDNRTGDERNYIVSPRLSFSSAGADDLFQLTVAPALNYDDLYNTTDVDWDFRLSEDKRLSQNWTFALTDGFFLGDDPVRENNLRTAEITPGTIRVQELEVVGSPGDEENAALTERYGRRRFWRNDFELSTGYTYAEDSVASIGYNYGVLRNEGDNGADLYAEYDRHDVFGSLGYRFTPTWRLDNRARYSKGNFDEDQQVLVITNNGVVENRVLDDLEEYQFQTRVSYTRSPHLQYFGEYRYQGADYEDEARDDYDIHQFLVGYNYDLSPHVRMTMYGGPVIGTFENSSSDTDVVAYGGLEWDVEHGTFAFPLGKGYSQNNFDGRSSGLSEFWGAGTSFAYQFTENLQSEISANYVDHDRIQDLGFFPAGTTRSPEFGQTLYSEKSYDAGASLSYTFAQWYHVSAGYRYFNNDSDLESDPYGDYDEHRVFVELSWGNELFRW